MHRLRGAGWGGAGRGGVYRSGVRLFAAVAFAACLLTVAALSACADSSEPVGTIDQAASEPSTAYKLYTLDEDVEPSGEDDPALDPYKRYLRKLDRGCTETEEELGDLALNAIEIVNRESTLAEPYKMIHLLEPAAAGAGTVPEDCTELFAAVGFSLLALE
jgi:hypothetical protein